GGETHEAKNVTMVAAKEPDDLIVTGHGWCSERRHRTEQHVDLIEQLVDPVAKRTRFDRPPDVHEWIDSREKRQRVTRNWAVVRTALRIEPCVRRPHLDVEHAGEGRRRALDIWQLDRNDRRTERLHARACRAHGGDHFGHDVGGDVAFVPADSDTLEI